MDGTRPALLDQMGFGNCVLVRNSAVNMEVISDYGCFFERERPLESLVEKIEELIASPDIVVYFRQRVRSRVEQYYNWEWVTDFYEDLFTRMLRNDRLISYDEYLRNNHAESSNNFS